MTKKRRHRRTDRLAELLREVKAIRQEVAALRLQVQWPGLMPYTIPPFQPAPLPYEPYRIDYGPTSQTAVMS